MHQAQARTKMPGKDSYMSCTHISELIPLYISRDLDESETEAVGQHLLSCEPCRSLESQYREADSWLKSLSEVEPETPANGELRARVNHQLDTVETKRIGWKTVVLAGAIAAALLITSAFALTMYKGTDQINHDAGSVAIIRQEPVPQTLSPALPKVSRRRLTVRLASHSSVSRKYAMPPFKAVEIADVKRSPETATHTPMRIEIQTSDPNIRIIWLTDNGGIE